MHSEHLVPVSTPYRLDLTVSVLRRLSTNVVDIFAPEGGYIRVLSGIRNPLLVRVSQERPNALKIALDGDEEDHLFGLASAHRILGIDRDLSFFNSAAAGIAWLRPLAERMRGVKPPRYPTLWEACVNAIVFQQLSLIAAGAIVRRIVETLASSISVGGTTLYEFPSAKSFLSAHVGDLRLAGLSLGKVTALQRVAEALESAALDEAMLDERSSSDAAAFLAKLKGIGPWTATLILLRGLGRLDVFPANDSGVARSLTFIAGPNAFDVSHVVDALGPQRGMLYYHLLLARLEARGEIGRPSMSTLNEPRTR